MASLFDEVVDDIKTQLDSDVPNNGVTFGVGELSRHENVDAPKIIWRIASGTIDSPDRQGGTLVQTDGDPRRQTPLYANRATVQAHITGLSYESVWELHGDLLRAVFRHLKTGANPGAYTCTTQEEGAAAHMYGGREVIVQTFQWNLVVLKTREQDTLTKITATNETCGIDTTL